MWKTARENSKKVQLSLRVPHRVTEALKASDQMEWVRRMNSIRARAEEVVYAEVIYTM